MTRIQFFGDLAATDGVVIKQLADDKVRTHLRTEVFRVL